MQEKNAQNRRTFLKTAAISSACVLCSSIPASLLQSCFDETKKPNISEDGSKGIVRIADEPQLQSIPSASKVLIDGFNNDKSVLILRNGENEFVVFAAQCTHKGAELRLPKDDQIKCPLHGSLFKLDGEVISGKAKDPLHKFTSSFDPVTQELTIG